MEPDPTASTVSNDLGVKPQPAAPTEGWLAVGADMRGLPGFAITVDGKPAALDAKGELTLQPGEYTIEITANGRDAMQRRARIGKGQKRRIDGDLVVVSQREQREFRGHIFLAGGAALAVGGFATMLLAKQADSDARDILRIEKGRPTSIPIDQSTQIEALHTRAEYEQAHDRAQRWALISNIAYGAAFVTTGISIGYLFLARQEKRISAPPKFAVFPIVDAGGGRGAVMSVEGALSW
jgi:hypothetical protein